MEKSKQEPFLRTYLNDHRSGSVAAVELVEDLIEHNTGERRRFFEELMNDLKEDQETLDEIISRIGEVQNPLKKSASWLSEKLSRLKFDWTRSSYGDIGSVEELEVLALGIRGKQSLWTLFLEVLSDDERFSDIDFQRLVRRARQQFEAVDQLRIETAQQLFSVSETS